MAKKSSARSSECYCCTRNWPQQHIDGVCYFKSFWCLFTHTQIQTQSAQKRRLGEIQKKTDWKSNVKIRAANTHALLQTPYTILQHLTNNKFSLVSAINYVNIYENISTRRMLLLLLLLLKCSSFWRQHSLFLSISLSHIFQVFLVVVLIHNK